jgi:hypothetical protein
MDPLSQPATYVYGIAPANLFRDGRPALRVPGIGGRGAPVRAIPLGDLVAVVSDVSEFRVDLTRENLLNHQRVLEEVLSRSDVLPFSFGTVAASDDEVREVLLRDAYEALLEELDAVRGCVELEVKVLWDEEQLFAEIVRENDEVRTLRDAIALLPEDAATREKVELGELTEAEIALKSEWEAGMLLDVLEQHAVDSLMGPRLKETWVLNAAFLVDRAREEDFDRVVAELAEAQAGRMIFNYVGPLPPYSFINLAFSPEGVGE